MIGNRQELLRELILGAVADLYESFEMVLEHVTKLATERGLSITRDDVAETLGCVIREGYVQAYVLSPQEPHSQPVDFHPDDIDELWFYVTPKGGRVVEQWAKKGDASLN